MKTQAPLNITDAQQDVATAAFFDTDDQPVTITGIPTWVSSDTAGAVFTVTPAADGMSAVIVGVAPGTGTVTVSGTNADGTTASQAFPVIVTADDATQVNITFGTPTPKAAAS